VLESQEVVVTTGKLISLFLVGGAPDGRIVGEISNWTGKAFKIPRRLLKASSKREELAKAGVYLRVRETLLHRSPFPSDKEVYTKNRLSEMDQNNGNRPH
jgi:hypothetical protein